MKKGDWGTAVQLHEKELREKYMCLYGNEKEYTLLLDTMKQYYEKRSDVLKKLDAQRLADPQWYRDGKMLGMTMYPKLFAGGLKGLIGHLPFRTEDHLSSSDAPLENAPSEQRRRLCSGRFHLR